MRLLGRKIPRRVEELHPRAHEQEFLVPLSQGNHMEGNGSRRPTCDHGIGASPARVVERRVRLSAIPKDLVPRR
jgi:hypothetical protein